MSTGIGRNQSQLTRNKEITKKKVEKQALLKDQQANKKHFDLNGDFERDVHRRGINPLKI